FEQDSLHLSSAEMNAPQDLLRIIPQNTPYLCLALPVNVFVTYSIVFFYLWIDLFSRCLWITSAFSPVRFNVHGI
ncbi:hypothetical protein, partial [Leclercia adecarboxylata]|uniref:hypothetical protein n=1 Tax=Leclercia adecarboxylata TaxID=83655 RepID=UPI000EBFE243